MKSGRKIIAWTVASLIGLVLLGSLYQWSSARADREQYPAPGELVEIDGLNIHIDCRGEGSPAIILEAGLTGGSTSWHLVHDALSRITRTCAYDRPGIDWSDPAESAIDSVAVAERLHELLERSDINEPKILVGMSAGGVFVREFHARYPANTVGMVLVDSSHEQQGRRIPALSDTGRRNALVACRILQPIGLARALALLDPLVFYAPVPEPMQPLLRANAYQSHTCASILLEVDGFEHEVYDDSPPASLGDLPLVVISQGKPPAADEYLGMTKAQSVAMRDSWDELQAELAGLSSRSEHLSATRSGHMIQLEQPEIVISALEQLLRQVRPEL